MIISEQELRIRVEKNEKGEYQVEVCEKNYQDRYVHLSSRLLVQKDLNAVAKSLIELINAVRVNILMDVELAEAEPIEPKPEAKITKKALVIGVYQSN